MTQERIQYYMSLLPSGIPQNEDTWHKLAAWIERNEDVVKLWVESPPRLWEELEIYRIFGCGVWRNGVFVR